MSLAKIYDPKTRESYWRDYWQQTGVYHFSPDDERPVYSIDTPPPTVSGNLHLGHVYSYSHTDFLARFWRMNGRSVFYPMGFDDNGLPTERLVEKRLKVRAASIGRQAFIERCLQVSQEAEQEYRALWQQLGLSIDWRFSYRTIDEVSRRACQRSFIDLYCQGLAYHRQAPAIWCPECQTSIAQAELSDLDRTSEFVTLGFQLDDGSSLPVATTRPELLSSCVAIFIHPNDVRYQSYLHRQARVPLFGQQIPILADDAADPEKGTGAVMCCTFGDVTDVSWWRQYNLPMIESIDRTGHMTSSAGTLSGLTVEAARRQVKEALGEHGLILGREPTEQSIRVHERCDTPVEYIQVGQWFIRILDRKDELQKAGEKVSWVPAYMKTRYQAWVENLNWDWCISRQRYFGVPFPVWYCRECGEILLANVDRLPVDPLEQEPEHSCPKCGGRDFLPETDIFDTWATSSMSPQIVGGWDGILGKSEALIEPLKRGLYGRVYPFSLRPQAHEIIRTWAFYTIVKSIYLFDTIPWQNIAISGWGIAGEGLGKISKSRGGGPMPPTEMIEKYSADAVRYWAASTGPGKDAVISEEKIQAGARLVTKLWNVARFSERFIESARARRTIVPDTLSPADRWILARLQSLIYRTTHLLLEYDYAAAKSEVENFFWNDLADNYLEMCKQRLYGGGEASEGALYTLYTVLRSTLQLFAPFLPYVTEEIFQGLFAQDETAPAGKSISLHTTAWPAVDPSLKNEKALTTGEILVEIATAVRRYKSDHNLPLGSELSRVQLASMDAGLLEVLKVAKADLQSITRCREVEYLRESSLPAQDGRVKVIIQP